MATATDLTFSQFMDLLLVGLHDAERGATGGLTNLNDLAKRLTPVPPDWLIDAAKALQQRGLVQCAFTFGAVYARLTGEGRLLVEQGRGTGIINEFRRDPRPFVHVDLRGANGSNVAIGDGNTQSAAAVEQARQPVFDLLADVERRLTDDGQLDASDRDDALADVDSLRRQLRKREPDRNVLAALLDSLGRVASVGVQVMTLIKMINN